MPNKKNIRTKGKLQLSRYFQTLKKGDFVMISREKGIKSNLPKRFQGRTGIIEEKRGSNYLVKIKDGNKDKKLIVNPIHLKK